MAEGSLAVWSGIRHGDFGGGVPAVYDGLLKGTIQALKRGIRGWLNT
jgi:hypothetical protein